MLDLVAARYELILVDCGLGVPQPVAARVLDAAHGLVVVTAPSIDAARATGRLLDRLADDGRSELVEDAVLVVNGLTPRSPVDLDELECRFAGRLRATLRLPWDGALAVGPHVILDALHPVARDGYSASRPPRSPVWPEVVAHGDPGALPASAREHGRVLHKRACGCRGFPRISGHAWMGPGTHIWSRSYAYLVTPPRRFRWSETCFSGPL
jgi:hypothetical protein